MQNSTKPQTRKGLIYYVIILTPCILIINIGLGSQLDPFTIAGFPLSQVVNWFVILGAAVIIRDTYNNKLWPLILILLIIFSKLGSNVLGGPAIFYLFYRIMLSALFLVLGAIYAHKGYYRLIYKPLLVICFVNVIWMVFQMLNLGDWTQFLTTEAIPAQRITYDILFVPLETLRTTGIQSRPTGLLRSNNALSGVLLFVLAIHLSREKRILWWGTVVLCAMIVLASARIVYTGFVLMGLMLLVKGSRYQKIHIIYSCLTIGIMLWLYSIFFPGLFDSYWTFDSFFYSYFIRLNNIVDNMSLTGIGWYLKDTFLEGTPVRHSPTEDPIMSGYTIFAKYMHYWPYFLVLFLIFLFYYKKGFQLQRYIFPQLTWLSILCLSVFIVYPTAVPIFRSSLYWFIGGFALLPIFTIVQRHYFRRELLNRKRFTI